MKKSTLDKTQAIIGAILTILILLGIGGCKYKFWKMEHPNAPTWLFFVPKG